MQQQDINNNKDKELVERILKQDEEAFRMLIKDNQRLVFSIVFKMLNNSADNKDICQDVFIKVYQSLPGFSFNSKLSTWIARIAYTTCINHLRKRKVQLLDDIYIKDEERTDENNATDFIEDVNAITPDKALHLTEMKQHVEVEINLLSPLLRTILILYHQEERSYEEIAEIVEMPIGTVKSYLFRARSKLKSSVLKKYKKEDLL
jgi:RNA polymerase sigma factor (sigma-70 family)